MQAFLGEMLNAVVAHPGAAAAAIVAIIAVMIIRAVISSSYRYR